MQETHRDLALIALPSVFFIPLLDALIPIYFYRPREIAGYFASLAFAREPIQSFFYLTPAESYASIHLHSILASPLVALGYHEGGRLISLLATILAAAALYGLGLHLTGHRAVGILAAGIYWLIPFTHRFAYAYQPEALSIALTTLAVYTTLRYVDTESRRAYYSTIFLLVLAVATHRWEALIALPVCVLLFYHDYQREAIVLGLTGVVSVAAVGWIVNLQPSNPSQLISYGIHNHGLLFLDVDWWTSPLPDTTYQPVTSYHLAVTALLPLSVLALLGWLAVWYRQRSRRAVLFASWFLAAVSIPVVLPAGFAAHDYYLWPVIAPLSLTLAVLAFHGLSRLSWVGVRPRVMLLLFLGFTSGVGLQVSANEYGALDRDTPPRAFMNGLHEYESYGAGRRIARYQSPGSTVTFIGEDFRDHSYDNYAHDHGRVLVYSDILVKARSPSTTGERVEYVENASEFSGGCSLFVLRDGRELVADGCGSFEDHVQ